MTSNFKLSSETKVWIDQKRRASTVMELPADVARMRDRIRVFYPAATAKMFIECIDIFGGLWVVTPIDEVHIWSWNDLMEIGGTIENKFRKDAQGYWIECLETRAQSGCYLHETGVLAFDHTLTNQFSDSVPQFVEWQSHLEREYNAMINPRTTAARGWWSDIENRMNREQAVLLAKDHLCRLWRFGSVLTAVRQQPPFDDSTKECAIWTIAPAADPCWISRCI